MDPFQFLRVRFCRHMRRSEMLQKVTTVVLIGTALALAACNTVRGAAKDVNSVANCTDNTMHGQNC